MNAFVRFPLQRARALTSLLLVSLVLAACAQAPITGRSQLMLVSEGDAQRMGLQAYQEIMAKSKLSTDRQANARVQRIGRDIARVSQNIGGEWEFNVIDEPKTINAWALPGGKVAVYTGLLHLGISDDELAAVMAHEVGHVIAQHSRERLSQAVATDIGLSVLGASGKLGQGALQAVNLALGIGVGLPFSRLQESEADFVGLNLMAQAGYNPRAAITLWQKMSQGDKNGPPEFLSTHPSSDRRMRDIEAALPKMMPIYEANKRRT
jgi:predicted Zn-dependent protease